MFDRAGTIRWGANEKEACRHYGPWWMLTGFGQQKILESKHPFVNIFAVIYTKNHPENKKDFQ